MTGGPPARYPHYTERLNFLRVMYKGTASQAAEKRVAAGLPRHLRVATIEVVAT